MTLIDSHCHLDFPQFQEDFSGVLSRAANAGVRRMVTISTRVRQIETLRAIAEANDCIYFSVGTHPHQAAKETDVTVDELLNHAAHEKCVAIGEAGLDYFYDNAPRDDQERSFRIHIDAARQSGLPLVIHARDADEDVASILHEETGKGAFPFILHCFSSGRALAETAVELGGYVSFSGILTFKRSDELRAIAADLPLDRLLIETDAPYLAPQPWRGQTNEPAYVAETNRILAECHGMEASQMAARTTENCLRCFSKMPPLTEVA
ncbi:TatD family hydrolase [Notoacmeibacter ruber]|uniref:TatD family deoxyribonuclease n=1 Tax=Notoacmeibacter ruber TaxID=2670375 RepID=A0A3L7JAV1_9HYPH|nr:TatD family hydrolase [Notoacmeibacter ruber]RLQ87867.1 TatD family deoxyribonuclease [Notoacmeibacter ruber]